MKEELKRKPLSRPVSVKERVRIYGGKDLTKEKVPF